jgi:hypothetical protein
MATKTLEELQVTHSEMLAKAGDLGIQVPDDLALEFETAEVGKATCNSLDKLIKEYEAANPDNQEEAEVAAPTKTSRKGSSSKDKEEKQVKTAKKAPAKKAAKKTAKKAPAKKAAKANGTSAPRAKYPESAKITIVDEAAVVALIKKGSKWSDRLKKIHASKGKKIADFGGSIADLTSAVKKGLVRVA